MARLQRARILDAVTEVVAERGYAETSVADVTEHGGLSRRTFYGTFDSKADAFFAAYDGLIDRVIRRMRAACSADSAPELRVHAALAELLWMVRRRPAWARVCVVEAQTASAIVGEYDRHLRPIVVWVEQVNEELRLVGPLEPAEQAAAVLGVLRVRIAGNPGMLSELLPRFWQLTIGGTSRRKLPDLESYEPFDGERRRLAAVADAAGTRDADRLLELVVDAVIDYDVESLCAAGDDAVVGALARAAMRGGPTAILQITGHVGPAPGGLSPQMRRCLRHVAAHPDDDGRAIGRALGVASESQLSRLVAGLRRRALIEDVSGGGRSRRWRVTAAGIRVLDGDQEINS